MSRREAIAHDIEVKKAEIAALRAELAALTAVAEPTTSPAVVFFEKTYGHKDRRYSYTAVRVEASRGARWYVTGNGRGRKPEPLVWEDLVEYMCRNERGPVQFFVATQLEPITIEK